MASDEFHGLAEVLVLLAGAVIGAPLARRLGLGTVLGYLAAGVVIGPILRLIGGGEEILGVAELGVVFLLFVIGLELTPARLWSLRRAIFGLGLAQVAVTGVALAIVGLVLFGATRSAAIIAAFGMALSSTAFAMQILEQDGARNLPYGRTAFAILLFQDLAIVPLLALVPLLAPGGVDREAFGLVDFAIAAGAVVALVLAGRYGLNHVFRLIGDTGAREAMVATALLVVLGAAVLMAAAGLSMGMGAFVAGVMLAESSYRHELEADIEPFRGILLGLFFMSVGLSLDLDVVLTGWPVLLASVPILMGVKTAITYGLSRLFGHTHGDSLRIGLLLAQGGEFGFVLFTAAAAAGIITQETASLYVAIVTLSMALTPLANLATRLLAEPDADDSMEEDFAGAGADVLMIGFSRFGQIVAQTLLAGGSNVTVIDSSAERVRTVERFGFRIYFGDGTRKDVLEAAGIRKARLVAVCTNKREVTDRIIALIQSEYPDQRLFVRSYDRVHSVALRALGVDYELRETLESALLFGRRTLEGLGMDEERALETAEDVRRRDEERLRRQVVEGIQAGRETVFRPPVTPEPLVKPAREGRRIDPAGKAEEAGEAR